MSAVVDQLEGEASTLWPCAHLDEAGARAIDSIKQTLLDTELEAENTRRLPPAALEALTAAGMFKVSLPAELGGWEADAVVELEVAEAIARVSTSACWNLVVGNFHSALPAAHLSDAVVKEMFCSDAFPAVAGMPLAFGSGTSAPGGFVVGHVQISWGSGMPHCDWVIGGATMKDNPEGPRRVWIAPKSKITVLDNWDAFGLGGSGSTDWVVDDLFISDDWYFEMTETGPMPIDGMLAPSSPVRGGPKYRLPFRMWPRAWHIGLMLGVAERSLEGIASLASRKRRRNASSPVADREVFRNELAQNFIAVSALRDYSIRLLSEMVDLVANDDPIPARLGHQIFGVCAQSARAATRAATMAHTFAGGDSVHLSNALQRTLRDVLVGQQHAVYADTQLNPLGEMLIDYFHDA